MSERLVRHLREESENYAHLRLLQSQWTFDAELIPKALQNVAALFPHYSRHDVSHSKQILTNVERLLGDRLYSLTATDTWLLLEAAYWHDIGMIVTGEDIAKDMQSREFKLYVEEIASQTGHELQDFAKRFSSLDVKDCFSAADTPWQAVECYRQLLAGWYRLRHPARAEGIVQDPWKEAGISSPRNELVPQRLFWLLGNVCRLHGGSFESVMESLPFCETGMAVEDCHPRFIACLLRLGDLFDLDNDRFCPVMLRVAGEIPVSSLSHIAKHRSIRHFRLDTDQVEISAVCPDYPSYEITDEWFRMIEDEIKKQMSRWKDIVPDRRFGLLPTLQKLEVNLAEPLEIINPGKRPRFTVDALRVIELFQGAGLYSNDVQSVRELLQNAVDATLMRIWLSAGENPDSDCKGVDWQNPVSKDVTDILTRHPIEVSLQKMQEEAPGPIRWRLSIKDPGIGLSRQDLNFVTSIGGSSRNAKRKEIISRIPPWMRPSGVFGIGLQSAFLISPEFTMETKSLVSGDTLRIRMTSPLGPERGAVYVQNCKFHAGRDCGTVLSLIVEVEAIPQSVSHGFTHSFTESTLAEFDPIRASELSYKAAKILDEIAQFSTLSPLPINLEFEGEALTLEKPKAAEYRQAQYFNSETGITLISHSFRSESFLSSVVAFRGQLISDYHPFLSFVSIWADIRTEGAADVLTISRNNIKPSARNRVEKLLIDTIAGYLTEPDCQFSTPEERAAASAFLLVHRPEKHIANLEGQWRNLFFPEVGKTIADIQAQEEIDIYPGHYMPTGVGDVWFRDKIWVSDANGPRCQLLSKHWHEHGGCLQIGVDSKSDVLYFVKERVRPFTDSYLSKMLLAHATSISSVGGRCYLPVAWGEFEALSADLTQLHWCHSLSPYFTLFNFVDHPSQFVLPFFFRSREKRVTTEGLDELCEWTLKHTLRQSVSEKEVRGAYHSFIKWVDDGIMSDSDEWRRMRGT